MLIVALLPATPIADETVHLAQARLFATGQWRIHPHISTWPTINVVIAGALKVVPLEPLLVGRAVVAIFAIVAAAGFAAVTMCFGNTAPLTRTLQFFALPIVLPYCALIYTDVPALAAILWLVYAALTQRLILFAVCTVAAIAFRQVNILWLFVGVALYWHQAKVLDSPLSRGQRLFLILFTVLVCAAWASIVSAVGGIALTPTTQTAHVLRARGIPNIEFAIAVGGLLFLPVLSITGPAVWCVLKTRAGLVAWLTAALLVGLTFSVKHSDNTDPAVIHAYLRNWFLARVTVFPWRWVFAGFVATSAFAFVQLPFARRAAPLKWPLYAVGVLSVLPFHLIEQRYYLPLFALIAAARAPQTSRVEILQLCYASALTAAIIVLIAKYNWFI